MTKLIVFDLDGTLARTNDVDRECYAQALLETLGMEGLSTDWNSYDHVTDESIVQQFYLERFGRPLESAENARVQARLIELFRARSAEFGEIPGAGDLVRRLLADSSWAVALATGSWRCSAEFKIQHTGLPIAGLPAAFAEDGPSRESIVSAAIERARRSRRVPSFERVVATGQADASACAKTTCGTFVWPARGGDAAAWMASGRWRNAERVPGS